MKGIRVGYLGMISLAAVLAAVVPLAALTSAGDADGRPFENVVAPFGWIRLAVAHPFHWIAARPTMKNRRVQILSLIC